MSRHPAQPSHCRPCCCPCRDLEMMSRHQACSAPFCYVATPCRNLPCRHPCRDLKHDVATSSPAGHFLLQLSQVATSLFLVATSRSTKHSPSLSQVATPKRMSRHQLLQSSFCIAKTHFFFFFFPKSSSSLSSCYSSDAVA